MASDTASKQKALPVVWTKIRGVIFDIDGTMVNSGQPHYEALSEVLAEARYKGALLAGFTAHRPRHHPGI